MIFYGIFKFAVCFVLSIVPLLGNTTGLLENTVETFWHSLYTEEEYTLSQLEGISMHQKQEKTNDKGCYIALGC